MPIWWASGCVTWLNTRDNGWRCWGGRRRLITCERGIPGLAGTIISDAGACIWWPTTLGSVCWAAAGQYPNLASRALALNLACLSADWQAAYGHPIVWVESFVDTQLFRGTAYKASGWQALGYTAGFKRVAEDFYELHERPKQLYGRELVKHAARQLRARQLPEPLRAYERKVPPGCQMPQDELSSFREGVAPARARESQRAWPAP